MRRAQLHRERPSQATHQRLRGYSTDTITFASDGGSPVDPISAPRGSQITLPPAPNYPGYAFDGWTLESPDEGYYTPLKSPYTITGSVTLYAQWSAIIDEYFL